MAKKAVVNWKPGAVFGILLPNNKYCLGQALGLMGEYKNVVNCAFFDRQYTLGEEPAIDTAEMIAVLSTTRDLLDNGHWTIVRNEAPCMEKKKWPNEEFAKNEYVGAKTYGSGIVNHFILAYYGYFPWDGYKDPEYFEKLLISPNKKPPESQLRREKAR